MDAAVADGSQVDELMELTAQSLTELEIHDRFDVIKEIGRGKYGHILLVTHRCKGTQMALKVVPKASTQLQSFLREYCTALTLSSHPSIVGMFGIVFHSAHDYVYALELTGRDLLSTITPKVGLPEVVVKRCALQIASALEFMHARGLVHRDVKPENVLLLDSACSRVKLADFGLAQRRGALIRFISATLPYMAPELCTRVLTDGHVSAPPLPVEPSLDTWAFGVLLFCILTGYFPWQSCTTDDDFYTEFRDWSGGGRGEETGQEGREEQIPSLWSRFSADALQMFQRLLATDPECRSSVSVVWSFVQCDWLKQTLPSEDTPTNMDLATPSSLSQD